MVWKCWRGTGNDFFFLEIDLAAGYVIETVARRSGDFQIEKHDAALSTIANMHCGPQEPTSLIPLFCELRQGIRYIIQASCWLLDCRKVQSLGVDNAWLDGIITR